MWQGLHNSRVLLIANGVGMTTPEDDPRTLKSWEDAFGYPIPTVRNIERRLRANVEEGRERLRGVVGYGVPRILGCIATGADTLHRHAGAVTETF